MNDKIKPILNLFLTFILISLIISSSTAYNVIKNDEWLISVDSIGNGFLEEKDDIKIVHLNGSYYEMGFQQGYLLKEDIKRSFNSWFYSVEQMGVSKNDLLDIWNQSKNYIPECYKQEMQGISDGANISFNDVASIAIIGIGIYTSNRCSFFSVSGNATKDGKLYHVHSSDWDLSIIDPDTSTYECNRQTILVRKPDIGYDSVSIALPGCVSVEEGMNERGIVISYTNVLVDDYSKKGTPMGLRQRMVLDNADTYLDAIDIMDQNKVCGKNFLISDGKIPVSIVMEQDANASYVSTWDDTLENVCPSWVIENVVRRGNFFLNYSISGLKDDFYKKSNLLRFVLYVLGFDVEYNYYYTLLHFKVLSKEVEKNWGDFDHNLSMNVLRNVYSGKTNLFYGIINRLGGSYKNSWSQIAYCPETGDFLLSFAIEGETAFKQKIHRFNFDDLINNSI